MAILPLPAIWRFPLFIQSALIKKEWVDHRHREQTCCQGGVGGGRGTDREFGMGRWKLVYTGEINEVLLSSTGNYGQYPLVNHNGKYENE